jgi:Permuted papain-like amidase enzyme, YaeF/YiiX, C92 family
MKGRLPFVRASRFGWERIAFILVFCLVFLMLFTGLFSRNAKAKRNGGNYQISGLAGVDNLAPEGVAATPAASVQDLIPGDILVGRCSLSPVPCLDPLDSWTHACIYIGKNLIVVAGNPLSGVVVDSLSSWMYPDMTWVSYLRVTSADEETRRKAIDFALSKRGQPYDLNWLATQKEGTSWYCSELVWAAYLDASGGAIDLSRNPDIFGVSPDEIYESDQVQVIGGHYERKPDTIYSLLMKVLALCILAGGMGTLFPEDASLPLVLTRLRRKR